MRPLAPSTTGSGNLFSFEITLILVKLICVDVRFVALPSLYSLTVPEIFTRSPTSGAFAATVV